MNNTTFEGPLASFDLLVTYNCSDQSPTQPPTVSPLFPATHHHHCPPPWNALTPYPHPETSSYYDAAVVEAAGMASTDHVAVLAEQSSVAHKSLQYRKIYPLSKDYHLF